MESTFGLPVASPNKTREYARRYASDEWETIKAQIERLYVQESQTLRQVIDILKQNHGFIASYVVISIFLIILSMTLRFQLGRSS